MYLSNEEIIAAADRYAEENEINRPRDYSVVLTGAQQMSEYKTGELKVDQEDINKRIDQYVTAVLRDRGLTKELRAAQDRFNQENLQLIIDQQEAADAVRHAMGFLTADAIQFVAKERWQELDGDIPF